MNDMSGRFKQHCKITWRYISQPIGDSQKTPIFNPWQFSRMTKIRALEHCLELEYTANNIVTNSDDVDHSTL